MSSINARPYESQPATEVAFLGLGVMGYPMAAHLSKAGHKVTVYNRTFAKAEAWVKEFGGTAARTPKAAAQNARVVFSCVGNDDDLRSVMLGEDGALAGMAAGALLVDHTTASAEVARELYGLAKEKGVGFVDGPVSGGQAGAVNGKLTVMCGGEQTHFDVIRPLVWSATSGPSSSAKALRCCWAWCWDPCWKKTSVVRCCWIAAPTPPS
jgi:3-hydroxyisobutyrate dehydrogenase